MRKQKLIVSVLSLVLILCGVEPMIFASQDNVVLEKEEASSNKNIYAPYNSFKELYDDYMLAVENNDTAKQEKLIKIGWDSLHKEKEIANKKAIQKYPLLKVSPDKAYWSSQFPKFFDYGYFEKRYNGDTLSLGNKKKHWSSKDKANGWNSVMARFYDDSRWDNTSVMEEQFYCHARLGYAAIEYEWNLEPWRTEMNPITCN